MDLKNRFEDYTEAEFTHLVSEIFSAEGSDSYQDELLENFIAVTKHPDGSDLIYYNYDDDLTPEKVVETVVEWRKKAGLSELRS